MQDKVGTHVESARKPSPEIDEDDANGAFIGWGGIEHPVGLWRLLPIGASTMMFKALSSNLRMASSEVRNARPDLEVTQNPAKNSHGLLIGTHQ